MNASLAPMPSRFRPHERAAEKAAHRVRDVEELNSGRASADELRARNGVISKAMRGARIDVPHVRSLG